MGWLLAVPGNNLKAESNQMRANSVPRPTMREGADMYIAMLETTEQERIVQALRGPQFDKKLHGGLFDRGSADSYYGRPRDPHWWTEGTGHGQKVTQLNAAEIEEYLAGYDYNEQYGDKKSWD